MKSPSLKLICVAIQGTGSNLLWQQMMGGMRGANGGSGESRDKKEEALLVSLFTKEAKEVATVQKRQQ